MWAQKCVTDLADYAPSPLYKISKTEKQSLYHCLSQFESRWQKIDARSLFYHLLLWVVLVLQLPGKLLTSTSCHCKDCGEKRMFFHHDRFRIGLQLFYLCLSQSLVPCINIAATSVVALALLLCGSSNTFLSILLFFLLCCVGGF